MTTTYVVYNICCAQASPTAVTHKCRELRKGGVINLRTYTCKDYTFDASIMQVTIYIVVSRNFLKGNKTNVPRIKGGNARRKGGGHYVNIQLAKFSRGGGGGEIMAKERMPPPSLPNAPLV